MRTANPAIAILSGLLISLSCTDKKENGSPVVARVNNAVLTQEDVETRLFARGPEAADLESVVSQWINEELLYQAAVEKDLHKDKVLKRISKTFRRNLLGSTYLESLSTSELSVTSTEVKEYYDTNKLSFIRLTDEAKINHFVLADGRDARYVKRTLSQSRSGGARKELFSTYRVDAAIVKRGRVFKPLDSAIFKSKGGRSVVGPIEAGGNYHVIEILNLYKKGSQIGLDEAYDEIHQRLIKQRSALQALITLDSLRAHSLVEVNLEIFK